MSKDGKAGLRVLIAVGVISLAFIIGVIAVTYVKAAKLNKEAEKRAREAFAAVWNSEEMYAQFAESMNGIVEDSKRRTEDNVRMLNSFNDRLEVAAEIEDDEERERAIDEVMKDQQEWLNGLSGEKGD